MPEPELDEPTLRRAAQGDRAASRRFVERYQSLVFALAAKIVGRDSPDVADIAQDTFLRAFVALPEFDYNGPRVSTWLATIATRRAIDAVRKRRAVTSIDAAREAPDPASVDPVESMDAAQRNARLARAMERLAPDQRAAMVLRIEHDMAYDAIAQTLGVDVGTVKSRLSRARQSLLNAVATDRQARDRHG